MREECGALLVEFEGDPESIIEQPLPFDAERPAPTTQGMFRQREQVVAVDDRARPDSLLGSEFDLRAHPAYRGRDQSHRDVRQNGNRDVTRCDNDWARAGRNVIDVVNVAAVHVACDVFAAISPATADCSSVKPNAPTHSS